MLRGPEDEQNFIGLFKQHGSKIYGELVETPNVFPRTLAFLVILLAHVLSFRANRTLRDERRIIF